MGEAKTGDTIKVHYTGMLDDGTQFDSSRGRDPLEIQLGAGQVIPGFEAALGGMAVGDNKQVRIEAEEAYGPRNEALVQDVPREALPDTIEPTVGMALQSTQPDGQVALMVITEVAEASITVDANHPLAGQSLTFEIELMEIV